jgi:hypothetical protein
MAKISKLNFDESTISFIEAVDYKIKSVIKFGVMFDVLRSVGGKCLIGNLQSEDRIFHGLKLFDCIIILALDDSYFKDSYTSVMSVESTNVSPVSFTWSATHEDL